ncbi:hypothetical protein N9Y52_02270 [Candidatus Pelagibacter bacterium]|jgi:hypothetical protein|nr:hypothetical protein [Candidatus Pelagibacter bacterium]
MKNFYRKVAFGLKPNEKELNLSDYAIIWISFIKGLILGLLIYHFLIL